MENKGEEAGYLHQFRVWSYMVYTCSCLYTQQRWRCWNKELQIEMLYGGAAGGNDPTVSEMSLSGCQTPRLESVL